MLTEICQELKNWFCSDGDHYEGNFTISGGVLTPSDFLLSGQYYRVIGSVFNDGVHKFGDSTDLLTDECFDGAVWAMRVPQAVITLSGEIDAWAEKYGGAASSPFQSESFKGYSYTKASGSGNASDWQSAFRSRLNKWRKI